jgi:uncharacterized protein YdeI (YjbR/CyaY-like superfamily)
MTRNPNFPPQRRWKRPVFRMDRRVIKNIDESRYKKYFSPRRKGSSCRTKQSHNRETPEEKKITGKGLLAIRRSKKDGSWIIKDQKHSMMKI